MPSRRRTSNRRALEETLAHLDVEPAVAQMLRSLAEAVDADPRKAALWREYREALMRALEDDGDTDDEFAGFVAALRGDTQVVDAEDGQTDPWAQAPPTGAQRGARPAAVAGPRRRRRTGA